MLSGLRGGMIVFDELPTTYEHIINITVLYNRACEAIENLNLDVSHSCGDFGKELGSDCWQMPQIQMIFQSLADYQLLLLVCPALASERYQPWISITINQKESHES